VDSDLELNQILGIYNEITGRNRTIKQHRWEWFSSPYENKSYVMTKKNGEIIGHHGILSIEFNYQSQTIKIGKTENTIAKKGFGPAYPKNEMAMFREYSKEYDVLITTSARGVIKKIREKLNYAKFARSITFVSLIDFSFFASRVRNKFLKHSIIVFLKTVNFFLGRVKTNKTFSYVFKPLEEQDLQEIAGLYNTIKDNLKFSQVRTAEFLRYRCLNNPYSKFQLLKVYNKSRIIGLAVYQVVDERLIIEDILSVENDHLTDVLSAIVSHAKRDKLAKIIVFSTLEGSLLDQKYTGFYRKKSKPEAADIMVNKLSSKTVLSDLTVENMYFTRLSYEGVI